MEHKKITGNFYRQLLVILVEGILTAVVINLLYIFIFWRAAFLFYSFAHLFQWPLVLVLGVLCSAGLHCLTKTTIWVSSTEVCIRRLGKKRVIPITESFHLDKKTKLFIIGGVLKYNHFKGILQVTRENQCNETYPLTGFHEKEVEELRAEIYARKLAGVPLEEKIEVVEESWQEERFVVIPKQKMLENEWKRLRASFLILGLLLMVLLVLNFGSPGSVGSFTLFLATAASGITFLFLLVEILKVRKNAKCCPEVIRNVGGHLIIDTIHFTPSGILEISMTAGSLRSRSVFPVQRYLVIESVEGKYVCWLGAEYEDCYSYEALCELLKLTFVFYPEKLVFNSKRSCLTR